MTPSPRQPEGNEGMEAGMRELWHPDRDEQMAAVEILLASPIPYELRLLLRERETELARRAV